MGAGLRVLHVIPGFFPAVRYGGPIESVLRLCQALAKVGVELEVATTDADGTDDLPVVTARPVDVEGVKVTYFRRRPRFDFAISAGLLRQLVASTRLYDLVHVTSSFSFPSAAAAVAARPAGVPYVVSPRGSCRGWALAHKRWKKAPYWHLVERRNLGGAAALHATSEQERDELLSLLPHSDVFTLPNGVVVPVRPPEVERRPRRILFLGRLHPVKGFDVLVPALAKVTAAVPDVETIVAGPDDVGEWARIQALVSRTQPRPRIQYVGRVEGDAKYALLASAGVLVLPSHSENFGQVVVEALSCATPVVASRNTPWKVVADVGAGAWVENSPDEIAAALVRVLTDAPSAQAMGRAGLELASKFSWPSIASQMAERYADIVRRARDERSQR